MWFLGKFGGASRTSYPCINSSTAAMTSDSNSTPQAPGRLLPLALKIIGTHLVLIIAVIVPLVIHENRQAKRDWVTFTDFWESKGESFSYKDFIPPEIPDEENFAASPIIAELFDESTPNQIEKFDFNNIQNIELQASSRPDLMDRQRAIGGPDTSLIDYLVVSGINTTKSEAATIILDSLEPLAPLFLKIEQTRQRTSVRYPVDYDRPITAKHNQLSLFPAIKALIVKIRAQVLLKKSADAGKDLLTLLHLVDMLGSDHSFIPKTIESAMYGAVLATLWEGLKSKSFTKKDLKLIDRKLKNTNLLQEFIQTIRAERAAFLDLMESNPEAFYAMLEVEYFYDHSDAKHIAQAFRIFGLSQAFVLRNKLVYSKFIQQHFLTSNDKINLTIVSNAEKDFTVLQKHSFLSSHPYSVLLSAQGEGTLSGVSKKIIQTSVRINLARIAIALELYRREHKHYPEDLSSLGPDHITDLPTDLFTGAPPRYRILSDGTPLIYSVGENGIDDGGHLGRDDLIWQYKLPQDVDKATAK